MVRKVITGVKKVTLEDLSGEQKNRKRVGVGGRRSNGVLTFGMVVSCKLETLSSPDTRGLICSPFNREKT